MPAPIGFCVVLHLRGGGGLPVKYLTESDACAASAEMAQGLKAHLRTCSGLSEQGGVCAAVLSDRGHAWSALIHEVLGVTVQPLYPSLDNAVLDRLEAERREDDWWKNGGPPPWERP